MPRSPAQGGCAKRGNSHYGLLVANEQRPARIPVTGSFSLAPYEADARGRDEHLAYGGVFCVEQSNRCPVAVVQEDRLWLRWRFAVDFESVHAVSHGGEALALPEGVDQTRIRQSTIGGHLNRLVEDGYPYVVADVAGQTAYNLRTLWWRAAWIVNRGDGKHNFGWV